MSQGVKLAYSEDDLRIAVRDSNSWRGVMRALGYKTTNGRLAAGIRLQAEGLGLDMSHFSHAGGARRRRTWPAEQLQAAILASTSWSEVVGRLGLHSANAEAISRVRGYAARLGLDSRHFTSHRERGVEMPFTAMPDSCNLRRAAVSMAMAWFAYRGYTASLPVESRPYDLIVEADGVLYRIQVKTVTTRDRKSGQFDCSISRRPLRDAKKIAYDPTDVDFFFIVDADGGHYIVPLAEVGGAKHLQLNTISHRKVALYRPTRRPQDRLLPRVLYAPIVKRRSCQPTKLALEVRVLLGARKLG
jgi:hypothetical protein